MVGLFVFLMGALAAMLGLLAYYYKRDRRFLAARTRDVMSPTMKQEIADEIEAAKHRQEKFKKSLANAAKLAKSQDNSLT